MTTNVDDGGRGEKREERSTTGGGGGGGGGDDDDVVAPAAARSSSTSSTKDTKEDDGVEELGEGSYTTAADENGCGENDNVGAEDEQEEESGSGGAGGRPSADDSLLMMLEEEDEEEEEPALDGADPAAAATDGEQVPGGLEQYWAYNSKTVKKELRKNLDEAYFLQEEGEKEAATDEATETSIVHDRIEQFEAMSHRRAADGENSNNNNNKRAVEDVDAAAIAKKKNPKSTTKKKKKARPPSKFGVVLRIRPSNDTTSTVEIVPPPVATASQQKQRLPTTIRTRAPTSSTTKQYTFSKVLCPETTQSRVYRETAAPLVDRLFFGGDNDAISAQQQSQPRQQIQPSSASRSSLLLCYGTTNAGKTHTVFGKKKAAGSDNKTHGTTNDGSNGTHWGVLPRAVAEICRRVEELRQQQQNRAGSAGAETEKTTTEYEFRMSCLEIYREQVYDLLPQQESVPKNDCNDGAAAGGGVQHQQQQIPTLKIRENQYGEVVVAGLSTHVVRDQQHGLSLIQQAKKRRRTSDNRINAQSSRSHSVYQLCLTKKTLSASVSTTAAVAETTNNFWVVDLAGSERSKRTGASAVGVQEASQINKSLMTLMRCLKALESSTSSSTSATASAVSGGGENASNNKPQQQAQPQKFPPYRDSKLTHLLMRHMMSCSTTTSNDSKMRGPSTVMIVNVHPSAADYDETQHVLSYGARAHRTIRDPVIGGGGGDGGSLPWAMANNNKKRQRYDINGRRVPTTAVGSGADQGPRIDPNKAAKKKSVKKASVAATAAAKRPMTIRDKVGNLLQKLSPKRAARASTKKRKAIAAAGTGTSKTSDTEHPPVSSSLEANNIEEDAPKDAKRVKIAPSSSSKTRLSSMATGDGSTSSSDSESTALVLQTENARLLRENEYLRSELEAQEQRIRDEVAGEADELISAMRTRYEARIGQLERQNARLLSQTQQHDQSQDGNGENGSEANAATVSKRHQEQLLQDRDDKIEDLKAGVAECEEEMARLQRQHRDEINKMKREYEAMLANATAIADGQNNDSQEKFEEETNDDSSTYDDDEEDEPVQEDLEGNVSSIGPKQALSKKKESDCEDASEDEVLFLDDIEDDEEDIEDDEEELEEEVFFVDDDDEEEDDSDLSPSRRKTIQHSNNSASSRKGQRDLGRDRSPLGSVSENVAANHLDDSVDSNCDIDGDDSEDDVEYIIPKRSPKFDPSTGAYKRPMGRKPKGAADWDERVGKWRCA